MKRRKLKNAWHRWHRVGLRKMHKDRQGWHGVWSGRVAAIAWQEMFEKKQNPATSDEGRGESAAERFLTENAEALQNLDEIREVTITGPTGKTVSYAVDGVTMTTRYGDDLFGED